MQKLPAVSALAILCFALGSPSVLAQDAVKGEAVFKRACAMCHSVVLAKPKAIAPTLVGIVGRKGGSLVGARYSAAMKKIAPLWDEATLAKYLTDPKSVVPGGTMMIKLPKPQDRTDVIAYLKSLK